MGEGHLTQRHTVISTLIDLLREAVRTSDDEDQAPCPRDHHTLDIRGESRAGELPSSLVEEHYPIRGIYLAKNLRTLHLLLQLGGELARAAYVGDNLQAKGQVMP